MKEPKLLADIRESHARAEKAAKLPRGAEHTGPHGTVSAVTPDVKAPPNNYVATTLDECTTVAHCEELLAHAKQHGFSEDGQTVKLIRAKLTELSGDAPATAARKRGRR